MPCDTFPDTDPAYHLIHALDFRTTACWSWQAMAELQRSFVSRCVQQEFQSLQVCLPMSGFLNKTKLGGCSPAGGC